MTAGSDADAMWSALREAHRTAAPVRVTVPVSDSDGAPRHDDLGMCRVLRYERRPRPGEVFEIATVQQEGRDDLRVVHRVVKVRNGRGGESAPKCGRPA